LLNGGTLTPDLVQTGAFTATILVNGVPVDVQAVTGAADMNGNIVVNLMANGVPVVLLTPASPALTAPGTTTSTTSAFSLDSNAGVGLAAVMRAGALVLAARGIVSTRH